MRIKIILAVLFLALFGWITYEKLTEPKTAYVLITDVYNGFDMKKEMEQKFTKTKDARQKVLDSLEFELKMLVNKIEADNKKDEAEIQNFNEKKAEYLHRKQQLEQDNDALGKEYDQQILTQLNQSLKDYGKENGYQYIFGNDGNGSLLYAEENKNITTEVIPYINAKYKGLK